MKIRRYLSMVEERHIRLVITLIVVVALGFLVNFFVRENDKAEKRRKEWQVGCKGGLGKAHSGLSTVSVFYSEELLDEYRRQMLLSLTATGLLKNHPDALRRYQESREEFRKLLDDGKVYFSVKNDTPVRFLGKSQQGVSKIHVSVMEGNYLGNSGWIDPGQYWCLDWKSPKSNSGGSLENITDRFIRKKILANEREQSLRYNHLLLKIIPIKSQHLHHSLHTNSHTIFDH